MNADKVSAIFNQHAVLVSWSVTSVGGVREDKSMRDDLANNANAKTGIIRAVRDHLPPAMRSELNKFNTDGRALLERYGVNWGGKFFLMPLQTFVNEVKPGLSALRTNFYTATDAACRNWHKVIAVSQKLLGTSFDPSALPATGEDARKKFTASYDVMHIPPAAVNMENIPEDIRLEIEADMRDTFARKMEDIIDTMHSAVTEIVEKMQEIGQKLADKEDNGHTRRSLQCCREKLQEIAEKMSTVAGSDNEKIKKLLKLVSTVRNATLGEWTKDSLEAALAGI